jgi:hypothetical protein
MPWVEVCERPEDFIDWQGGQNETGRLKRRYVPLVPWAPKDFGKHHLPEGPFPRSVDGQQALTLCSIAICGLGSHIDRLRLSRPGRGLGMQFRLRTNRLLET